MAEAVWDDETVAADYVDAVCSMHGLSIAVGRPDNTGRMSAGELALTLDNRDGAWSQWDAYGRLVDWMPGRSIHAWARMATTGGGPDELTLDDGDGSLILDDGDSLLLDSSTTATSTDEDWWLFAGTVTAWREQPDGTVEVEAVDAFSQLNDAIGLWHPGTEGDTPAQRLEAICTSIDYSGPTRFDDGDVTLYSIESDRTPLEEIQQVAASDGGIVHVDADGTLVYRDRLWTGGRGEGI